jgi:beta-glucosidase
MVAGLMVLALGGVGFGQAGDGTGTQAGVVTAQQTKGTADARAGVLLSELTLEEKIGLLSGAADGFSTKAVERLGIPSFTMSDGPNGVRNGPGNINNACAFPCGAALAATWDPALASAYGKAVGLEGRARGTHFQLGPGLNICRVPVNGRNFEYFGEDPYLAGVMATRWAKACSEQGVVPTIKHFAANNQETNRNTVDAEVEERVLREIYLPAFERAVKEGGIVSVMCSYNRLNGRYASNNAWLLDEVLKKEWGFEGLVMSDWGASHEVSDLAKGLDLEMPNGKYLSPENLKKALAEGVVTEGQIDSAVRRLLRTAAGMGWLDAGWVQKRSDLPLDSQESAQVALEVARASMVLLKNEKGALPLDRAKVRRVVVVGPNAGGGLSGLPNNVGGGGSGAVNPFSSRHAEANYLQGLTDRGQGVNVIYLPDPPPAPAMYQRFANAFTADGKPGLTLKVEVTGQGEPVTIEPVVQQKIDATWEAGKLPFGVPEGRDATYTWSGNLVPAQEGDWQLVMAGTPANVMVTVDGKRLASPGDSLIHLSNEKETPVTIQVRLSGRAGGNRGGRGPGMGRLEVLLSPPLIPDMEQVKGADAAIVCVGVESERGDGGARPAL